LLHQHVEPRVVGLTGRAGNFRMRITRQTLFFDLWVWSNVREIAQIHVLNDRSHHLYDVGHRSVWLWVVWAAACWLGQTGSEQDGRRRDQGKSHCDLERRSAGGVIVFLFHVWSTGEARVDLLSGLTGKRRSSTVADEETPQSARSVLWIVLGCLQTGHEMTAGILINSRLNVNTFLRILD